MHHRNITFLFKTRLYLEALGSLYILKIYSAERGRDSLDDLYDLIGILLVYLNVKRIKVRTKS